MFTYKLQGSIIFYWVKETKLYKKDIEEISNEALDILVNHSWPGNIRELENVIEYAVVRTKNSNSIDVANLPNIFKGNENNSGRNQIEFKKENASEIVKLLEKHKWNKTAVAKELGVGRTTLWRMLKRTKIEE